MRKLATLLAVMVTLCMVSPMAYAVEGEDTNESEIATEDIATTVSDADEEDVVADEHTEGNVVDELSVMINVLAAVLLVGGILSLFLQLRFPDLFF